MNGFSERVTVTLSEDQLRALLAAVQFAADHEVGHGFPRELLDEGYGSLIMARSNLRRAARNAGVSL